MTKVIDVCVDYIILRNKSLMNITEYSLLMQMMYKMEDVDKKGNSSTSNSKKQPTKKEGEEGQKAK